MLITEAAHGRCESMPSRGATTARLPIVAVRDGSPQASIKRLNSADHLTFSRMEGRCSVPPR